MTALCRRRFLFLSAAALLAGPAGAGTACWQMEIFGGTVTVELRGPDALAPKVFRAIAGLLAEIDAAASLFRPDSALVRLNAEGRLDNPPPILVDLCHLAARLHHDTGGCFDPTVQPLWRALAEGKPAAPAARLIGWNKVTLSPGIRLAPGQALTFNGLAQGYAADRVVRLLRRAGYRQVLVDMGEYAAIDGPFDIGIEDPDAGPVARRKLQSAAIATSSPGALRIGPACHILGPAGEPPLWSTVSVEAWTAARADGFATAFCLMPESTIRAVMQRLPDLRRVVLVDQAGDMMTL